MIEVGSVDNRTTLASTKATQGENFST